MTSPEATPNGRSGVRRGLVENEILEAAALLFAAQGFAATSLQDVADAVGVSRPALYHYFASKDEILARLTDGLIESTSAAISEAMDADVAADKQLALLVRALAVPVAESPGRFRLLLTKDASIQPEARTRLRALEATVTRSLGSVIEGGIASGVFRRCDPKMATFSVLGMINWVAWWYVPGGRLTVDQVVEALIDMASATLKARSASKSGGTVADTIAAIRRDLDHLERQLPARP